jgi:hypothetical protein
LQHHKDTYLSYTLQQCSSVSKKHHFGVILLALDRRHSSRVELSNFAPVVTLALGRRAGRQVVPLAQPGMPNISRTPQLGGGLNGG